MKLEENEKESNGKRTKHFYMLFYFTNLINSGRQQRGGIMRNFSRKKCRRDVKSTKIPNFS